MSNGWSRVFVEAGRTTVPRQREVNGGILLLLPGVRLPRGPSRLPLQTNHFPTRVEHIQLVEEAGGAALRIKLKAPVPVRTHVDHGDACTIVSVDIPPPAGQPGRMDAPQSVNRDAMVAKVTDSPQPIQARSPQAPRPLAEDLPAPASTAANRQTADAVESDGRTPFLMDVTLGSHALLYMGAMASFELFELIFLQGELGAMPPPYARAVETLLTDLTNLDGPLAQIVNATLSGALVGRTAIGIRPFRGWGFELVGGYTLLRLNGEVSGMHLTGIIDESLAPEVAEQLAQDSVNLTAHLHNIHVGMAWRFLALDDQLVIRPSIEYMQTLAVDMDASTRNRIHRPTVQRVVDDELVPLLVNNVKLPLIGIHVGYRFQ